MTGFTAKEKIFIILIFCTAAFLRLYAPLQYPLAINQDELNNIYDARSIAETGQDRWQTPNPFILRGLGNHDNRPALQAWIIAGVFKITGYSVAVGRSVNAVLGVLSLWLLFLFLKNSFNKNVAFAGLLVAALLPWHILFARMAHEGAVLPFLFVILILYLWQKCRAENYINIARLLLLGFVTGFSANAYQATKVSALLFAFIITIDVFIIRKRNIKPVLFLAVSCFIGALPQVYTLYNNPDAFFARAKSQSIALNSFDSIWLVIKNIASNLDPMYLFFSSEQHNNLSLYRLYPIEIVFFYTGLVLVIISYKKIKNNFPLFFIALAALVTILPAALTFSNPHALRASGFVIITPIFTALGWGFIVGLVKNINYRKVINYTCIVVLIASAIYTINGYVKSTDLRGRNQQHYLVQLYQQLAPIKDNYSQIYIENTTGESYLYLISFCDIKPSQFQQMEKKYSGDDFDDFMRLDKYYFVKEAHWQDSLNRIVQQPGVLVIAQQQLAGLAVIDSSLHEKSVFYFMTPQPTQAQKPSN